MIKPDEKVFFFLYILLEHRKYANPNSQSSESSGLFDCTKVVCSLLPGKSSPVPSPV